MPVCELLNNMGWTKMRMRRGDSIIYDVFCDNKLGTAHPVLRLSHLNSSRHVPHIFTLFLSYNHNVLSYIYICFLYIHHVLSYIYLVFSYTNHVFSYIHPILLYIHLVLSYIHPVVSYIHHTQEINSIQKHRLHHIH